LPISKFGPRLAVLPRPDFVCALGLLVGDDAFPLHLNMLMPLKLALGACRTEFRDWWSKGFFALRRR